MRDTDTCCTHLHCILYADDTVLIKKRDNDKLNAELQDVKFWLIGNKLSLNTDKTELVNITGLSFTKTKNIKVKTSGAYIKNGSNYKYLGLHVDCKLNFFEHIEVLKKKTKSFLKFFLPIKEDLNFKTTSESIQK